MMNNYSMRFNRRRWPKVVLVTLILLALVGTGAAIGVRRIYTENLKPLSSSQNSQIITIKRGTAPGEIASMLEQAGLIRKAWAFEWYIKSAGIRDSLQAGTYALKPSLSTQEIAAILTQGRIATDLVTILPGQRLDQIRDALINDGFDQKAVDRALDPSNYANHPALVDKPKKARLEGYLYPESFQKTAETDPQTIIRASLDQLQKYLTPDIRRGMVRQGLTVHEGIILASIIEMEVGHESEDVELRDKRRVAQIFLTRLKDGIALESDATAPYGAVLDGQPPSLTYDSPYNTYLNKGLPPGPISNVSRLSLEAVANPADTDFLFFVSGDDGTTHFSRTLAEHEENIRKYCTRLCGR